MSNHPQYDRRRFDEYTVLGRVSSQEEHVVEDARTGRLPDRTRSNRAHNDKKRYSRTRILITVLITIFAFSLTLFGADILSGRSSIAEYVSLFTGKKNEKNTTFYAVYAMSTENMALAYQNASAVRSEGGAGYVLKDQNTYYVILNVYLTESDARSVAAKEANYGIYEMISLPLNTENEEESLFSTTEDLYSESYLLLYETANDLASKKYGEEDMKHILQKQREKIAAASESYAEKIRGKEDNYLIEYKVLLAEIKSAFDNLLSVSKNLVADARYYAAMILHSHCLFTKKYAK